MYYFWVDDFKIFFVGIHKAWGFFLKKTNHYLWCESVSLSVVSDSLWPPWTIAHQAPLSMGFPTGVGCYFLLQRIFLIQGSNSHLLHWQADSLPLSHQGSPIPREISLNFETSWELKVFVLFVKQKQWRTDVLQLQYREFWIWING